MPGRTLILAAILAQPAAAAPVLRLASPDVSVSIAVVARGEGLVPGARYVVTARAFASRFPSGCAHTGRASAAAGPRGRMAVSLVPALPWCPGRYLVGLRRSGSARAVATRSLRVTGPLPIPVPAPPAGLSGTVVGRVVVGPLCPVEPCSRPQPVVTLRVLGSGFETRTATRDGWYALDLAPGAYRIAVEGVGIGPPPETAFMVTAAHTRTAPLRVDLDVDTGIR